MFNDALLSNLKSGTQYVEAFLKSADSEVAEANRYHFLMAMSKIGFAQKDPLEVDENTYGLINDIVFKSSLYRPEKGRDSFITNYPNDLMSLVDNGKFSHQNIAKMMGVDKGVLDSSQIERGIKLLAWRVQSYASNTLGFYLSPQSAFALSSLPESYIFSGGEVSLYQSTDVDERAQLSPYLDVVANSLKEASVAMLAATANKTTTPASVLRLSFLNGSESTFSQQMVNEINSMKATDIVIGASKRYTSLANHLLLPEQEANKARALLSINMPRNGLFDVPLSFTKIDDLSADSVALNLENEAYVTNLEGRARLSQMSKYREAFKDYVDVFSIKESQGLTFTNTIIGNLYEDALERAGGLGNISEVITRADLDIDITMDPYPALTDNKLAAQKKSFKTIVKKALKGSPNVSKVMEAMIDSVGVISIEKPLLKLPNSVYNFSPNEDGVAAISGLPHTFKLAFDGGKMSLDTAFDTFAIVTNSKYGMVDMSNSASIAGNDDFNTMMSKHLSAINDTDTAFGHIAIGSINTGSTRFETDGEAMPWEHLQRPMANKVMSKPPAIMLSEQMSATEQYKRLLTDFSNGFHDGKVNIPASALLSEELMNEFGVPKEAVRRFRDAVDVAHNGSFELSLGIAESALSVNKSLERYPYSLSKFIIDGQSDEVMKNRKGFIDEFAKLMFDGTRFENNNDPLMSVLPLVMTDLFGKSNFSQNETVIPAVLAAIDSGDSVVDVVRKITNKTSLDINGISDEHISKAIKLSGVARLASQSAPLNVHEKHGAVGDNIRKVNFNQALALSLIPNNMLSDNMGVPYLSLEGALNERHSILNSTKSENGMFERQEYLISPIKELVKSMSSEEKGAPWLYLKGVEGGSLASLNEIGKVLKSNKISLGTLYDEYTTTVNDTLKFIMLNNVTQSNVLDPDERDAPLLYSEEMAKHGVEISPLKLALQLSSHDVASGDLRVDFKETLKQDFASRPVNDVVDMAIKMRDKLLVTGSDLDFSPRVNMDSWYGLLGDEMTHNNYRFVDVDNSAKLALNKDILGDNALFEALVGKTAYVEVYDQYADEDTDYPLALLNIGADTEMGDDGPDIKYKLLNNIVLSDDSISPDVMDAIKEMLDEVNVSGVDISLQPFNEIAHEAIKQNIALNGHQLYHQNYLSDGVDVAIAFVDEFALEGMKAVDIFSKSKGNKFLYNASTLMPRYQKMQETAAKFGFSPLALAESKLLKGQSYNDIAVEVIMPNVITDLIGKALSVEGLDNSVRAKLVVLRADSLHGITLSEVDVKAAFDSRDVQIKNGENGLSAETISNNLIEAICLADEMPKSSNFVKDNNYSNTLTQTNAGSSVKR